MTGTAASRRADCERIAREAAALLRSRFGDPGEVRGKGDPGDLERWFDVVTEVDDLSEALVLGRIAELNPDALVLAEEGGMTDPFGERRELDAAAADELWIVDPLDGTINFAHGVPHFCVSIACWRGGVPFAGAIADPMVGDVFSFQREATEERGQAFHDGSPVSLATDVTAATSLLYVGGGGPSLMPLMRRFRSWRRMGSAALALAWVGVGRCGAYVQPGNLYPWDWAVGVPFVLAAGGTVSDAGGADWAPHLGGTSGVIAGPPAIQAEIGDLAVAANTTG